MLKEWKDTLQSVSLKLVSILVKHHARIIRKGGEKQTMQVMSMVNTIIQAVTESKQNQSVFTPHLEYN